MTPSHTVTITVQSKYTHGEDQYSSITIMGNGDLDHMIESFKASLVAAGFSMETAKQLEDCMNAR